MTQHDDVLVRRPVENQCGDRQQRVKPASRLIHRLGNKLSRELFLEQVLIFKGIMMLCKRHGSGIEPAVDHLRYPVHLFAADRTLDRHGVDIRPVQFDLIGTVVRQLF